MLDITDERQRRGFYRLDRLVDGVTAAGGIEASVERLMHNLANEVRIVVGNESATGSLPNWFDKIAHDVAERVLASTPMVMGTYPAPKKAAHDRNGE